MAAPSGSMSDSESSNSSSDAEELARCREASMPAWGLEQRPRGLELPKAGAVNNQLPTTQPSLRYKVDEHEQDGNELQTTPEFRAHVAKKLGVLLDSSITISEVEKEPIKAKVQETLSEDDGFRLFFTSIPKGSEKEASPQPCRKRLPSSSSSEDSDEEWKRCQEAAVSASDILQESAIHSAVKVVKEEKREKKKQKKKAKKEANVTSATATTITGRATVQEQEKETAELNGDQMSLGMKKKKRKKKTKRTSEASPSLPAKSAGAMPVN